MEPIDRDCRPGLWRLRWLGPVVVAVAATTGPSLPVAAAEPPAASASAEGALSSLAVLRDGEGRWMARLDYRVGAEARSPRLSIELTDAAGTVLPATMVPSVLEPGAHTLSFELQRPMREMARTTTTRVAVTMRANDGRVLSRIEKAQRIDWPDLETWVTERRYSGMSNEELLRSAVELIDQSTRGSLAEAKRLLERIVLREPKAEGAYIELARVAMKQNWGPEGLHQAESLLASARQINPASVNAKILLGYVYAHQARYREAESLLQEASQVESPNLWLWANWGELLLMQGKEDQAVAKYREALRRPRSNDTYDRARLDAYRHLLVLLEGRRDLDGLEALHRQRSDEFGPATCYGAEYGRFVLQQRGDSTRAIALVREAIAGHCEDRSAREVLGLAYYLSWVQGPEAERSDALNQARVYLPSGPRLIYLLAGGDRTAPVIPRLLAGGEAIDQRDNDQDTALAQAMRQSELDTARRLLRFGARADALVGHEQMPVALLPVVAADLDGVRLMQESGVDYATLRYRGATAKDFAKSTDNRQLLDALGGKNSKL